MNTPLPQPRSPELHSMPAWHRALACAISATGAADFPAKLVSALCQLTSIESFLIGLERKDQSPLLLYQQGTHAEHQEALINHYYSRGYLLDPFCLAVENGLAQGFYHLADIAPDDFFSSEYYKTYYLKTGSVEDCYYIADLNPQCKISLCMYQGLSAGRMQPQQLELLRLVAPVVQELLLQYGSQVLAQRSAARPTEPAAALPSTLPQQIQSAFMSFGSERLTEREREVAHLMLRGHSIKSSAQSLQISPETVRMHRKNIYTKLAINSQAELFALFIDWLTSAQR